MKTEFLRVTPNCCDESNRFKIPYLEFVSSEKNDYELLINKKPKWCMKGIIPFHHVEFEESIEIKSCPFCGKNVPEIEINPLSEKEKIYNTDSGDYCETCNERSMYCKCLPAPLRWKPVGVELKIPKRKKTI